VLLRAKRAWSASNAAQSTGSDGSLDAMQLTLCPDRQGQCSSLLEPFAGGTRDPSPPSASTISASAGRPATRPATNHSRLASLASLMPQAAGSSWGSFQGFHPLPPIALSENTPKAGASLPKEQGLQLGQAKVQPMVPFFGGQCSPILPEDRLRSH
jgi:hypothetical protein